VTALVSDEHAECAVNVMAYARVHGRLDFYSVNGEPGCSIYGVQELRLRLQKGTPSGIEILVLWSQLGKCLEPKTIGRL
jgi:hypothetical protein